MRHLVDIHHGEAWPPVVCAEEPYRYQLSLRWASGAALAAVGLHPSAGAVRRWDAALWRLSRLAKSWGYAGLTLANLNARIVGCSDDLGAVDDPVGPRNDDHLRQLANEHDFVLLAWGERAEPVHARRVAAALWWQLATHGGALGVLGWTPNGQPCAPARGMTTPLVPISLTAGAHPEFVDVDRHWANLLNAAPSFPVPSTGGVQYA